MRLNKLMSKERIIQLRGAINEQVFLHERLGKYIQRLVAATRPYNPDTDWHIALAVRAGRARRRSRRVAARDHLLGPAGQGLGAARSGSAPRSIPEDIQDLAPYILGHRIWLGPHAASHGLTTDAVIQDVIERSRSRRDPSRQGCRLEAAWTRQPASEPFVSLADITEIELLILKRMREVTIGEHRSRRTARASTSSACATGSRAIGCRAIDWAQSTLTNF